MPVVALWGIIVYVLSLAECQSFYMIVDVDVSHVGSLVPSWFAWHIVRYEFTVDSKVLEANVLHRDVVAVVYAYATLIVYLVFCMFKYFDSVVQHVVNQFVLGSFAVQTYHDRMCHVSPHHEILDCYITATAMIILSGFNSQCIAYIHI